jgi:hypothetical protein
MPDDIKAATAYREFFEILEGYARIGLKELRVVNPLTRISSPPHLSRSRTSPDGTRCSLSRAVLMTAFHP